VNFRAGSLIKPFASKRRSRLRQTISLRAPLVCLQSHSLHTSCEMKRLLLSGCDSIILQMVAISCLVTDRLRYVMIVSIPDTITHQELERKLFLKKITVRCKTLNSKRFLPVNGYAERIEEIQEGETLRLDGFAFEVLHTPGHSPGHISLYEKNKRILLSGDLVGRAPAWYTPTSGGVIGYLESLQKMEDLNATVLLPAHGQIIENPAAAIQKIRIKLLQRESILKKAVNEGGKLFMELNQILFESTHFHFFPGCGIIESHLIKLEKEGAIKREGQRIIPNVD